jgi:hypothetical protein
LQCRCPPTLAHNSGRERRSSVLDADHSQKMKSPARLLRELRDGRGSGAPIASSDQGYSHWLVPRSASAARSFFRDMSFLNRRHSW